MKNKIKVFIPHTDRKGLLFIASVVWLLAGGILLTRGVVGVSGGQYILVDVVSAFAGGLVFYIFMFSRISNKHVKRISNMEPDKIPFYAFFNKRSYLMMFSMIGLGISLRLTGWIPLEYLSAFYITMGMPLLASSVKFLNAGVRFKE